MKTWKQDKADLRSEGLRTRNRNQPWNRVKDTWFEEIEDSEAIGAQAEVPAWLEKDITNAKRMVRAYGADRACEIVRYYFRERGATNTSFGYFFSQSANLVNLMTKAVSPRKTKEERIREEIAQSEYADEDDKKPPKVGW